MGDFHYTTNIYLNDRIKIRERFSKKTGVKDIQLGLTLVIKTLYKSPMSNILALKKGSSIHFNPKSYILRIQHLKVVDERGTTFLNNIDHHC